MSKLIRPVRMTHRFDRMRPLAPRKTGQSPPRYPTWMKYLAVAQQSEVRMREGHSRAEAQFEAQIPTQFGPKDGTDSGRIPKSKSRLPKTRVDPVTEQVPQFRTQTPSKGQRFDGCCATSQLPCEPTDAPAFPILRRSFEPRIKRTCRDLSPITSRAVMTHQSRSQGRGGQAAAFHQH